MKSALSAIKSVRASKSLGIFADFYTLKDSLIYASDGRMSCAARCPAVAGLDCLVPGDEFERLVARLDGDIAITRGDSSITLSAGRMRGTIKTRPTSDMAMVVPEHPWQPPPEGLVPAMRRARPFVAEVSSQSFRTCLALSQGRIYGIQDNNVGIIEAACPGLAPPTDLLLPYWAADFVIWAEGTLMGVVLQENYCAFQWDGLWLRSSLVAGALPASVGTLLARVSDAQPLAITPTWRAAYAAVAGLSDEAVTIEAGRILGGGGHSEVVHETDALDLAQPVKFTPRYLTPVIDAATAWNPGLYPAPVQFVGEGCKGLVMGRR